MKGFIVGSVFGERCTQWTNIDATSVLMFCVFRGFNNIGLCLIPDELSFIISRPTVHI